MAVFFVISGFLLYRPLVAARMAGAPRVRIRDYARRRALRIIPAYWVALTVLAIYPGLPGMFGPDTWVYYGFGQDYRVSTVTQGIGPAWSLGCEVIFYALLPFLSIALALCASRVSQRHWWWVELAALAVLALASAGLAGVRPRLHDDPCIDVSGHVRLVRSRDGPGGWPVLFAPTTGRRGSEPWPGTHGWAGRSRSSHTW